MSPQTAAFKVVSVKRLLDLESWHGSVAPSRNLEPERPQEEDLRREEGSADTGFENSASVETPPADQSGCVLVSGCREGVGVRRLFLFLLDPIGIVGDFGEDVGAGNWL